MCLDRENLLEWDIQHNGVHQKDRRCQPKPINIEIFVSSEQ